MVACLRLKVATKPGSNRASRLVRKCSSPGHSLRLLFPVHETVNFYILISTTDSTINGNQLGVLCTGFPAISKQTTEYLALHKHHNWFLGFCTCRLPLLLRDLIESQIIQNVPLIGLLLRTIARYLSSNSLCSYLKVQIWLHATP